MSEAGGTIAIVGVGAILPDAPDADAFWRNLTEGHYCISEVDGDRWDPALYFDPDPKVPEHTYSKIGGWVRDWEWDPLGWKLPIPPKVSDAMDDAQKWGLACTRMALLDYGWPERALDFERTAVVFGNAMAGEHHYLTSLRLSFPELARELAKAPSYAGLPEGEQEAIARELHSNMEDWLPPVTEDTMPGELGNCLAGRVANLFNLRGPNFVVDAACASAMAAMDASIEGLIEREFDAVVTGGIDRNMGASTFIKFCAIGALSATGTRPYAEGADGFVMGEGAALFVLKRLEDAERDGDRIYAVVRGVAGSSDGKGKGITAPNPVGQKLAVERGLRAGRGTWHLDSRRRRRRGREHLRGLLRGASRATLGGARLGEVEHRAPQGRGRGGRPAEGGALAPPQGPSTEPQLRPTEPEHRLVVFAVRREHRAPRVGDG
jgi:acyl transferase domain-containing protein